MLAVITAVSVSAQVFSVAANDDSTTQTEYIGELTVARASSSEQAKKKLTDNGYEVFDQDLMEGAGGSFLYIGYKTTNDKSKAITDINMMNMNGGFRDVKYREIAESQLPELDSMVDDLQKTIAEVRENFAKGSPAAKACVDALNLFTYKTLDGSFSQPLGNWIIMGKTYDSRLRDLLLIGNQKVVGYIYGMLALGVADYNKGDTPVDVSSFSQSYTNDNPRNWLERFASYTKEDFDEIGNEEKEKYRIEATALLPQLKNFADEYKSAIKRAQEEKDGKLPDTDSGFVYLSCYDFLNKYSYNDIPLGEYILGIADGTYDSVKDMYPLLRALTDGQRSVIRTGFLTSLLLSCDNTKDNYSKIKAEIKNIKNEIKEENGGSLSVWYATDVTLYDKQVGITDTAARASAASSRYDYLNPTVDSADAKIDNCIDTANAIMKCSFGAAMVISAGFAAYLGTGSSIIGTLAAMNALAMTSVGWFVGALCVWAPIVLGIACVAVIFWCFVTKLVMWAKEKYDYYHPTYSAIPDTMFSYDNDNYIEYTALTDIDTGKPIDINDKQGNSWNALYYTRDTQMGEPIEVKTKTVYTDEGSTKTYLSEPFKAKKGDGVTPKGYKPVASFGESVASNLNMGAFNDKVNGIYLFFLRKDTDGKKDVANDGTKYVTSIKIFSAKSEESAKLAASREGYTVLNRNLTKNKYSYSKWNLFTGKSETKVNMYSTCSTELYTYLGYKTTTNPKAKDIVTDIRVTYNYAPEDTAFNYGVATYANAGTFNAITVWFTTRQEAGDPIVDDFVVLDKPSETPRGYEAVSLFADTNAFDLNYTAEKKPTVHQDPIFLYFKPSVNYGDSQEYIGGITFVNSHILIPSNSYEKEQYATIDELGSYFYSDLVGDVKRWDGYSSLYHHETNYIYDNNFNTDTYMKFTFTRSPKRAITNIYSYSGLAKNVAAPDNITIEAKGYAVSKSYYYSNINGFYAQDMSEDTLYIATSNSYKPLSNDDTGSGSFGNDGYAMALYMCGPTGDTKDALRRSDIKFSHSHYIPNGDYKAVNDITQLEYASTAKNLANQSKSNTVNDIYMFLRTSSGVENFRKKKSALDDGKYISAFTSTVPDSATDKIYRKQYTFSNYDGREIVRMQNVISALAQKGGQLLFYNYSKNGESGTQLSIALRVSRTNDYNRALTDVKFKVYTDLTPAKDSITINSTVYKNAGKIGTINGKTNGAPGHAIRGSAQSSYEDFSVYMYTTQNGSIDSSICDFSFDGEYFINGMSTAYFMDIDNVYNDKEYEAYEGKKYKNFAGLDYPYDIFMHFKHETKYDKYVSQVKIFASTSRKNAISYMANEGYRYFYDYDLNTGYTEQGKNHFYTYLAYKMDDRSAITNIVACPVEKEANEISQNIYLLHRNSTQNGYDKNDVSSAALGKFFTDAKDVPNSKYYRSVKYNALSTNEPDNKIFGEQIILYYTKSKYAGAKNVEITKNNKTSLNLVSDPIVSFSQYKSDNQEAIYNAQSTEATPIAVNRDSNVPIKKADYKSINIASSFTKPSIIFIASVIAIMIIAAIMIPIIKRKQKQNQEKPEV